jgi:hypothetical protein
MTQQRGKYPVDYTKGPERTDIKDQANEAADQAMPAVQILCREVPSRTADGDTGERRRDRVHPGRSLEEVVGVGEASSLPSPTSSVRKRPCAGSSRCSPKIPRAFPS